MRPSKKDSRISCRFCGVKTWSINYVAFMHDHDRPDGRRCLRARKDIAGQYNARVWGSMFDAYCDSGDIEAARRAGKDS